MGGESVITSCKSGMTVDDAVIAAVREHGDMLCLSDYSGNIDPGPGECFPRPGSRLVNPALLVNCVPDLGKCLLEPGVLPNEPGFVISYFNPGT